MPISRKLPDGSHECIDCKKIAESHQDIDHEDWCIGTRFRTTKPNP